MRSDAPGVHYDARLEWLWIGKAGLRSSRGDLSLGARLLRPEGDGEKALADQGPSSCDPRSVVTAPRS
jgi:hypothetical protein